MSQQLCESRKKAAVAGDGLVNRKCIDCPGGGLFMEEEKEVLKCKTCGSVTEDSKKYLGKSQECRKCYGKRWLREKGAKNPDKPSTTKSLPHGDAGVSKPATQKPKPANGSAAAEKLDYTIKKLNEVIGELENKLEAAKFKLSVCEEVRGMLG
ncbi:MAG: hypothetical protein A2W23_00170 [Planctomycetes bacterium RBG_16_43_13]|nr:MAG: hypothetical protein A2W23_00170 [Planctomycetes bacterium RBG_16_43_13]